MDIPQLEIVYFPATTAALNNLEQLRILRLADIKADEQYDGNWHQVDPFICEINAELARIKAVAVPSHYNVILGDK